MPFMTWPWGSCSSFLPHPTGYQVSPIQGGEGIHRGEYQRASIVRGHLELAATPGLSDSPTRHLSSPGKPAASGTVASGVTGNWEWGALEEGACQLGALHRSRGTQTIAASGSCVSAEGRRSHLAVITLGETQRMIRPRRHCSQTHGLLGNGKWTQGANDQEKGSPSSRGPRSWM